ncbi:hypothetical protein LR48_Vigan01g191900 [Vigna angularis]|uniref:FAD dependent oxidoreductase domain-containing protein n=2 Tax=Phaseolus angularis TaxID=3914 RepID=A0A0L9TP55_PHAAN|nr:putative oxidoreductase TDA3 [Vigna angularis]KAG2408584.1 uncharacterized protein HKW66_Vig0034060 [Vigna angularis]KOM32363.1 hypothetical protein LR48_Vigan01g191900 [Vigna angularis]BAT75627.1 hypothetical protein VIGAN_01351700 [Vigna angularis var. angularis]
MNLLARFPLPPVIINRQNRIPVPRAKSIESSSLMDQPKKVIVCGGGVIGVCTAYFLAEKGAAVTLIEMSDVACAASGKAGGFLAYDWCDGGPLEELARVSFNLHRSLSEKLDGPRSYGYRALTTLSLTVRESERASASRLLPSWIDGPARSPKTIGTPETTAQVHPQLFTRTIIDRAVEMYGVKVEIAKLERVEVEEGRVGSVVLEGGRELEADAVVLAVGPWSSKLGLISSLFRVYGLKAHSIVLEPRDGSSITPHALFLSYHSSSGGGALDPEVYPRPTGEVYVCGMSKEEEVPDDPAEIRGNPESIAMLKRVAKTVSSHLGEGEAGLKAEQACFLPCTDDGIPVIGEVPGVKGCYVATGHNCWGILNGPATGAALAQLILHGHSAIVDLKRFSPSRFLLPSNP